MRTSIINTKRTRCEFVILHQNSVCAVYLNSEFWAQTSKFFPLHNIYKPIFRNEEEKGNDKDEQRIQQQRHNEIQRRCLALAVQWNVIYWIADFDRAQCLGFAHGQKRVRKDLNALHHIQQLYRPRYPAVRCNKYVDTSNMGQLTVNDSSALNGTLLCSWRRALERQVSRQPRSKFVGLWRVNNPDCNQKSIPGWFARLR